MNNYYNYEYRKYYGFKCKKLMDDTDSTFSKLQYIAA